MNKVKEKLAELHTVIAIGRHAYRTRVLEKRAAESI